MLVTLACSRSSPDVASAGQPLAVRTSARWHLQTRQIPGVGDDCRHGSQLATLLGVHPRQAVEAVEQSPVRLFIVRLANLRAEASRLSLR